MLRALDVDKAAALGDLAVVQWLEAHNYHFTPFAMVEQGHLHIVESLFKTQQLACDVSHEGRHNSTSKALSHAVRKNHVHVVTFLLSAHNESSSTLDSLQDEQDVGVSPPPLECSSAALDKAAGAGHLDVVRLIHENLGTLVLSSFTHAAIDNAATNGHLAMVEFLHFHTTAGCSSAAMDGTARFDHLEIVHFLHEYRSEGCTTAAMGDAARFGHFEVVQFLHSHRSEGCTTDAMDDVVGRGCYQVLVYLHERRSEGGTVLAMDRAASNGNLEIVRFLHENRQEGCTTKAIDCAARNGNLEIVMFLCGNRSEGFTQHAYPKETDKCTEDHRRVVAFLEHHQEKKRDVPWHYSRYVH